MTHTWVVVSVGGSCIVPDDIDTDFIASLKSLVLREIKNGKQFIIITGGGKTARNYQKAASKISPLTSDDVDWLGIHATRLNAHLLRTVFFEQAHPIIITNPKEDELPQDAPVVIAAGFRPGASTDLRAVELAERVHAKTLVNLSNIEKVYDTDPKINPDAKPIDSISWPAFRKLLPEKWDPGLSAPFDPIAAKKAEEIGLTIAIIQGTNISAFDDFLQGRQFTGTTIA